MAGPLSLGRYGYWLASWRFSAALAPARADSYDAVLTGFLFCGHLWADRREDGVGAHREWTRRAEVLIPPDTETATFSASLLFAAVYPKAVRLGMLHGAAPVGPSISCWSKSVSRCFKAWASPRRNDASREACWGARTSTRCRGARVKSCYQG